MGAVQYFQICNHLEELLSSGTGPDRACAKFSTYSFGPLRLPRLGLQREQLIWLCHPAFRPTL